MDIGAPDTPRWVQRFEHFDRVLLLLREGLEMLEDPGVIPIVKEGVIQRFEYTFELAWKTLKDFLVFRRVTLDRISAADVIRTAFAGRYIDGGEDWMSALDARNEMSHVYREQAFDRVLTDLRARFMPRLEDLHEMLLIERLRLDHG